MIKHTKSKLTEPTRAAPSAVPIVAIGASAGGLEALQELLSAMRFPCDHAIFVIQHLGKL